VCNSVFNTDIDGERGQVFCSLPLAELKVVKNHFGITMNDVFLALVAGSLRDYLLDLHELPDRALRTFIAVSLRTEKDEGFSNKVTTATVTLATDLEDPEQRLRTIAKESVAANEGAHHGRKGALELYQMLPPPSCFPTAGTSSRGCASTLVYTCPWPDRKPGR
jgi:diacylglycerol O-acyltransferase